MPRSPHRPGGERRRQGFRPLQGPELLEDRTLPSAAALPAVTPTPNDASAYKTTDVLVDFRPGATPQALSGTTLGQALDLVNGLYEVQLSPGTTVNQALAAYQVDPAVLSVSPDYYLSATGTASPVVPNDPSFSQQWDLHNTGQNGGTPGADVHAEQAWSVTTGSSNVTVAVMDSGIDYNQPDLYRNVWINQAEIPNFWYTKSSPTSGYDKIVYKSQIKTATPGQITFADLNNSVNKGLVWDNNGDGVIDAGDLLRPFSQGGWDNNGNDTRDGDTAHPDDFFGWNFVTNTPFDDNGHGSHVSGTIAATGNNGIGVAGIDWNAQIMPVKFIAANGTGAISDFVSGLNYAVQHGAKISNNSWEGAPNLPYLQDAIANARNHGQIFVAAAGNTGGNSDNSPVYPADFPLDNIVSVAATDNRDQLASFSAYGAHSVDLGAPGVGILSTTPNKTYSVYSGTSMAAPHVTGALALVWGLHPSWTYTQVINQVLSTVDKVPSLTGKSVTGGVLDVAAAVGWTAPPASPPVVVASVTPQVVSTGVSGPSSGGFNLFHVNFNEPIVPSSFTPSAVQLVRPDGQTVSGITIEAVAGSNNTKFNVLFPVQTEAGTYTLTISSAVHDGAGKSLAPWKGTYTDTAPQTFANTTRASIPDRGTMLSTITVPQNLAIQNVQVLLNITHTDDSDLYIHLQAPDGTDILLVNRRGGTGQNFTNTLFSEQAGTAISAGQAPFTGSYRPEVSLSYLNGRNAQGTWKLWVTDAAGGHVGTLNSWSLILTAQTPSPPAGTVRIASVDMPADTIPAGGLANTSSSLNAGPAARGNSESPSDQPAPGSLAFWMAALPETPAEASSGAMVLTPADQVFTSAEAMTQVQITYVVPKKGAPWTSAPDA
jgi:subtilisin family serine protease/subtilisin-like proprotein convertase family protein